MNGMKNLDKIVNKRAKDPFDRLIFEQGVRVKDLRIYKDLDLMVVVLNMGKVLNIKISDYPLLKNATKKQLNEWSLISDGIGIRWEQLDEDLSVKGFIKSSALYSALRSLQTRNEEQIVV